MLRRRKESDLFCPNVAVYTFDVHFDNFDDFDDFDMTIEPDYQHLALAQSAGTSVSWGLPTLPISHPIQCPILGVKPSNLSHSILTPCL
jgi:hypothetical protein